MIAKRKNLVRHVSLPVAACFGLAAQAFHTHAQTSPNDQPTALPDVVVSAAPEPANTYAVTNATTASKIEIPLLETPQAVSVVPETLLRDQNVRKLEDALYNVAGVTVGGYYSDWDYYRIRGFDAAFTTYFDGLRGDYSMNAETYGLERIEVVKGPASPLYGQGPLGGMVNLVSKRPRPEPFADYQFTLGSWQFYEPAVDLNTPLNEDRTVYARLTALYRNQGSFIDFAHSDRVFIAPALTWEISPQTSITFLTHFLKDWTLTAMPLPARGTVLPNPNGEIPINRFIGEPDSGRTEQWRAKLGYELRHQFNHIFALRQNLSLNRMSQHWPNLYYPATQGKSQPLKKLEVILQVKAPKMSFGQGLGGGGIDRRGDATYQNMFELPAYGLMDAAIYYTRGPFRAQVNVNNVLDEEYFAGSYNELYVLPGEPINVRATIGWAF